ncbi:hypothetical protein L7F22_064229 [Adiantum nelumboides]|nr:hypothetical protein [Adiantum nelumboides]
MQSMVPNPMYANIGLHPGFQGTQGQFGVSQGNLGMAGFSIPPVNMTPRHQHVTGQGVQMAPHSVPRSAPYIAVQEKKLLLKLAQSPNFKMEGANVERDAEVWLEAMDDYFEVAGTHPQNQTMLAMFKLIRDAKIWWKMHIRDSDIIGTSQSWEEIKDAVTARYLPPAHKTTKMNDFFSLCQLSFTLEEYYFKFVTLQRYEPKMTLEQQVARFCQGLIEPLNNRLENFRLANLQDPLLRAKTLAVEIQKAQQATTAAIELPNVRCYECQEYGHYRNRCLRITRASEANAVPVNATARGQPNNCEGQGRVNRGQGRGAVSRTNAAIGQPTVGYEANERVVLHTAIDYSELLKHDKVLSKRQPLPHLKTVPEYMRDPTTEAASKAVKLARAAMGHPSGYRKKRKYRADDPLKSFSVTSKKRKSDLGGIRSTLWSRRSGGKSGEKGREQKKKKKKKKKHRHHK